MAGLLFEVLEAIERPSAVYGWNGGELLAARELDPGKYLIAIYREVTPEDGFVITAFLTRRYEQIQKRRRLWPS